MFFPIFIERKKEDKVEEKLYTATEVEELIIKAVSLVGGSEIINRNGIKIFPRKSCFNNSVDIFIKQGNFEMINNIKIQRVRGEK